MVGKVDHKQPQEVVSDYRGFDLEGLWKRRGAQTELESEILRRFLRRCDASRVVELGVGFGRLSPGITKVATHYVGVDLDLDRLLSASRRVTASGSTSPEMTWIQANLLHLPLAPRAASTLVAVRVLHHFASLSNILARLTRVVRPGGSLILSYAPRPSWGTLLQDLQRPVSAGAAPAARPVTLARRGMVEASRTPFPVYTADRAFFEAELKRAGLRTLEEIGAPENVRSWYRESALHFGRLWPRAPVLSQLFTDVERLATPTDPTGLAPSLFACPRCETPVDDLPPLSGDWEHPCPACGFQFRFEANVLRAVFFSPGAQTRGPTLPGKTDVLSPSI